MATDLDRANAKLDAAFARLDRQHRRRKVAAKELAVAYEKLDSTQLELVMERGELKEICNDDPKSTKP